MLNIMAEREKHILGKEDRTDAAKTIPGRHHDDGPSEQYFLDTYGVTKAEFSKWIDTLGDRNPR